MSVRTCVMLKQYNLDFFVCRMRFRLKSPFFETRGSMCCRLLQSNIGTDDISQDPNQGWDFIDLQDDTPFSNDRLLPVIHGRNEDGHFARISSGIVQEVLPCLHRSAN
jgi:hypothetical protein